MSSTSLTLPRPFVRIIHLLTLLLAVCTLLTLTRPSLAQTHYVSFDASYVDLSHIGVHTHENYIYFNLAPLSDLINNPYIRVVSISNAHCDFDTNLGSLPYVPGVNITSGHGTIEDWDQYQDGAGGYIVLAPSAFANYVNANNATAYFNPAYYYITVGYVYN